MSNEILILESPDSFNVGTYTERNKALHGKSWTMTDYYVYKVVASLKLLQPSNFLMGCHGTECMLLWWPIGSYHTGYTVTNDLKM